MRVFFATDIHGSEVCWRKFLNSAAFYKADLVILGGDLTGKVMVPIVVRPGSFEVTFAGEALHLETEEEVRAIETRIRNRGFYPTRITAEELLTLNEEDGSIDRRFTTEMIHTLDRWLDMADSKLDAGKIPCYLNGGNDDTFDIDNVIEAAPHVNFTEGKVVELDGFYLASMGYTNPTPWDTFREESEPDLAKRIESLTNQIPDMGRAIFNFHAPPFGSGLDDAPALDENLRPKHGGAAMEPVGSKSVADAITKHQPMLSVHGHIHESRGIKKMGRTLAMNPGSVYTDGVLQGAVIDLNEKKKKVTRYILVNG
jgi:Icc-related predicted phosphoesterase